MRVEVPDPRDPSPDFRITDIQPAIISRAGHPPPGGPDGPIIDGDYRDVTERAEPSGTGRRLGPGEDGRPERGKKLPE